ncbi:META domain-containing protein [Microbacterium sp. NPDC055683]
MDGGTMRKGPITAGAALLLTGLALTGCATSAGSSASAAALVGTWQSSEQAKPYLTFEEDGSFRGNDGCNGLSGTYDVDGDTVTLTAVASTLKGCIGVDTWLSKAVTVKVGTASLEVFDRSGDAIGSLAKDA